MCLGFIGGLIAANAEADALEAQAREEKRQAWMERDAASYKANIQMDEGRRIAGQQVAASAANGLMPSEAVMTDTANQAQMDVQAIRYGGEVRASNLNESARIKLDQAASIRSTAPIIAGATLLTDAFNFGTSLV